ncbi:MAG: glutathione synthetase [Mobiluncus sp.]|uniref:ATP-grasp domain-containing protein n=1 Tax=Mobiluncus sp. TaxID=47293 RepID=UPI002585918C|nr:glutathione synthetase [Mobiluncus sp.]MCI6585110.1 glutathione synthetase [Mobiluncus sp.]
MSDNKVILVMSSDTPKGLAGDEDLCDALRGHGIEPVLRNWDDPSADWSEGRFAVLRSAPNYAHCRDEFLKWARSVPKLVNPPDILEWNTDKHYLRELEKLGMPIIPTTWLEPNSGLTKHQVHTRFPAYGDFVVKPTVSSGGRGVGRYTSTSATSRMEAIDHAMTLLSEGSGVMIQRYMEEIETHGEVSIVYYNGVISHTVQKTPMLHSASDDPEPEEIVTARYSTQEEWGWGEQVRRYIHDYIKLTSQHDTQVLYDRIDLVADGKGSYYVMEIGLVEGNLYLDSSREAVDHFADAIIQRFYW